MRAIRRFTIHPALPPELTPLRTLMLNLRWSWHAPTRALFAEIDPVAWESSGHDPAGLLANVSHERLAELSRDDGFLLRLREAVAELGEYKTGQRWYQLSGHADHGPAAIAYFSPEYGITAALPQYSGGLGILAGDHLKSASDLGVPLIGVGLLYRHGYFTQSLSAEGWQAERYPASDPAGLPIALLRDADGAPARVTVGLPGGTSLAAQIWVVDVGRIPLLLLDSYTEDNDPLLREVTDRLYGGGSDHRLRQELLLGIGGVRAARLYCSITGHPQPEVFHTNEGHAGFLGIERIRQYLAAGASFAEAVELTRAGTVFTTHTPVPAGIDRFDKGLIESQFGSDSGEAGLPLEQILAFGAETYEGGDPDRFNMAVMGMRLAQRVNGVSKLHGEVSREMFTGLWPGFDTSEVPIGSITNGVHGPTWVAPEILRLAEDGYQAGAAEWLADEAPAWEAVAADPARIFQIRQVLRARLVAEARSRLRASWQQRGASDAELSWIASALDENVLTIGFARRVPSYKRLTLMLQDPGRLTALLLDPERPVQIVIAGKAHPADDGGKALIQEMVRFTDDPAVRHRIVFLPDYDMELGRTMVQGCDVWLNNPLRPLEACGTSGMKAALNGALNVSVRDGWWDEWFDGDNGWAIPSADSVTDQERRDNVEASALYDLLGRSVAPLFYDRGPDGLPRRWLEMVTHTLRTLGPNAQATRMAREYTTDLYLPAARSSRELSDGADRPFAGAAELAAWKQRVTKAWPGVRVEHVESHDGEQHPGARLAVRAGVALGELSPDDVTVEVLSGRTGDDDEIAHPVRTLLRLESAPGSDSVAWYSGEAVLGQPGPFGYTVRVLPSHPELSGPAEMGLVAVPVGPAGMLSGDLR